MISSHDKKIELPAEWEPQSGLLLAWPHSDSDWQDNINEIEATYIEICKTVTLYQKLVIVCYDQVHQAHISKTLNANSIKQDCYILTICKTNDTWCRDYGPISTRCNGSLQLNNFIFNGWGNKYSAELDNTVPGSLYKAGVFGEIELIDHDFILEGGSIDTNGHGTFLTTSCCLLERQSSKSKKEIENALKIVLGAKTVHWLNYGALTGDDTDSHIDNLARFVNKDTIVYCACDNEAHPNFISLRKMEAQLRLMKQEDGKEYKLIPLYLPKLIEENGGALPASYINFLIINKAVLVPTFDVSEDETTLEIMRQCFPERSIIGINSNALIKQFGGLHCATMNLPAGAL